MNRHYLCWHIFTASKIQFNQLSKKQKKNQNQTKNNALYCLCNESTEKTHNFSAVWEGRMSNKGTRKATFLLKKASTLQQFPKKPKKYSKITFVN